MTADDLLVDRVTVDRGGRTVVDNVSFRLAPGDIVTVVGPNGEAPPTGRCGLWSKADSQVLFDDFTVGKAP